jgi:hypothetical protein
MELRIVELAWSGNISEKRSDSVALGAHAIGKENHLWHDNMPNIRIAPSDSSFAI